MILGQEVADLNLDELKDRLVTVLDAAGRPLNLKIFATDMHRASLEAAGRLVLRYAADGTPLVQLIERAGAVPGIKFGVAFCEASGKCLVRWSGTEAAMIDLAQKNAQSPMVVTELGMVTLVRLVQPANALLPIVVTLSGMVMPVRL